jgi:DNA (cytosine-5)-methyltransferase 1
MNEKIKTLSLFAGIGGIDLGLEATGYFETVQFVEYDPYCQHILKRHWPDVPVWGDVKTFDPDSCGEIDCIVGGYPCQPFSVAGKQKGTQDDRHLWPRMFEIIKHKRPSLILCENVSGHIVLGLDEVLLDLEGEGYSTRAFVIPASAVDANHKRERVWIVAYSNSRRYRIKEKKVFSGRNTFVDGSTDVANTKRMGWEQRAEKSREPKREEPSDQSNNSSQGCTESKPSKNVANTQSFGSDGREHQHDTKENREKGAIGIKVRRESSTENVANSQDIRHEFSTHEEKQRWDTTRHSQGKLERDGADVPNTQGEGLEGQRIDRETSRSKETGELDAQSGKANVSNTNSQRGCSRETRKQATEDVGQQSRGEEHRQGSIERRLGGVVDGVPSWLDEPDIPRVTTNQAGRVQRLKMLGNAVVPQVVYQLGLAMKELWDEV